MKKLLLLLSIFGLVYFVFFNSEKVDESVEVYEDKPVERKKVEIVEVEKESEDEEDFFEEEVIEKKTTQVLNPADKASDEIIDKVQVDMKAQSISPEEFEDIADRFEQIEEEWDSNVKQMFLSDPRLGAEAYSEYEQIKSEFQAEKLEAFEKAYEEMRKNYGDNFSYTLDESEVKLDRRIIEDYQERARHLMGEDNYKKYLEKMSQANDRLMEEAPFKNNVITIEM